MPKIIALYYAQLYSFLIFKKFIHLFLGERENNRAYKWEGQKEEREFQVDSALSAEPEAGLHLKTLRS